MKRSLWMWSLVLLLAACLTGCGNGTEDGSAVVTPPPRVATAKNLSADGSVNWIRTYVYDDGGRCVREETRNEDGSWGHDRVYTFDEAGRLAAETLLEGAAILSEKTYTYDDGGFLVRYHADWDGAPELDETYAYDDAGRKVSMERSDYQTGTPGWKKSTVSYVYDKDGLLLWEEETGEWIIDPETKGAVDPESDTSWSKKTVYSHDAQGRLLRKSTDALRDPWWETYTYDEAGLLLLSECSDGGRTEYRYDGEGNCLEEKNTYPDPGKEPDVYTTLYTYEPAK